MSYLGNLSIFDHKISEWTIFKGRLNQFLKVNSVVEDNRSGILITHLSDESYRLLRNLAYPKDLENLKFSELDGLLDAHFKPKGCTFADKARFYGAEKSPDESMGEWAARLRGLSSYCNFGTALELNLKDHFVLGLGAGPARDKLFEQEASTLTMAQALEIAEKAEAARAAKTISVAGGAMHIKEEPIYRSTYEQRHTRGARGGGSGGGGSGGVGSGGGAATSSGGAGHGQREQRHPICSVCGMKGHGHEKCRFKGYRCQKCGVKCGVLK